MVINIKQIFTVNPLLFSFQIETVSSDFAVELITELANACLAAPDAPVHNCCAFAIQDAIATYDCTNTDQSRYNIHISRILVDRHFCKLNEIDQT